jgi:hypothetical protein
MTNVENYRQWEPITLLEAKNKFFNVSDGLGQTN